MEPFNLDQEREDGFFTKDGGYVERNQADSRDAWIESLEGVDSHLDWIVCLPACAFVLLAHLHRLQGMCSVPCHTELITTLTLVACANCQSSR